jgi:hypothetical protein
VTGDTYSHVMADEAEVDYAGLLGGGVGRGRLEPDNRLLEGLG